MQTSREIPDQVIKKAHVACTYKHTHSRIMVGKRLSRCVCVCACGAVEQEAEYFLEL